MGRGEARWLGPRGQDAGEADCAHRPRGEALNLYLDTSALLKLHVDEEGSPLIRHSVEAATLVGTSAIAYVEARAALARRRRSGHLSSQSHRIVLRALDADWQRYIRLEVTEDLIHEAATIAEHYALRAYDAIHLASAVLLSRRLGGETMFASWDDALDAAAAREGLRRLRG